MPCFRTMSCQSFSPCAEAADCGRVSGKCARVGIRCFGPPVAPPPRLRRFFFRSFFNSVFCLTGGRTSCKACLRFSFASQTALKAASHSGNVQRLSRRCSLAFILSNASSWSRTSCTCGSGSRPGRGVPQRPRADRGPDVGCHVDIPRADRGPAAGCRVDIPRAGRGPAAGCRVDIPRAGRGPAAGAAWIFRGPNLDGRRPSSMIFAASAHADVSKRRRGCRVDIPPAGRSTAAGCRADIP